jgi:hypothetical protein
LPKGEAKVKIKTKVGYCFNFYPNTFSGQQATGKVSFANAKVRITTAALASLWGLIFNLKLRLKLGKFASGIKNTSSIYGLV